MNLNKIAFLAGIVMLVSCNEKAEKVQTTEQQSVQPDAVAPVKEAMLSEQQFEALDMKIDTLGTRLMSGFVEANGQLEVPPQNEAVVTPVIGGNLKRIVVIEGEEVKQGQVLAYLEHPDIVKVQTEYINASNRLKFQEKEFQRQQKLYEAGVGSGETFQRSEAELQNARGNVVGLKAQLRQLKISPASVEKGNIQEAIPVLSPIDGAVQAVNVKTGQFVPPQTNMFEVINNEHVHVDLMVFEKDVAKVTEGQTVHFRIESFSEKDLEAKIISVSKNFEQNPKAVHVHAEIIDRPENLIPGMYVRGRIAVEDKRSLALPEAAIAKDGDRMFIFTAEEEGDAWSFKPVEIIPGTKEGDWREVKLLKEFPKDQRFAYNNAYYLMAEMNKGEGGHSH